MSNPSPPGSRLDPDLDQRRARLLQWFPDSGHVVVAFSGGVDSTVAARLIAMALGPDRLRLLHVDNGLMRKDESTKVIEMFRDLGLT